MVGRDPKEATEAPQAQAPRGTLTGEAALLFAEEHYARYLRKTVEGAEPYSVRWAHAEANNDPLELTPAAQEFMKEHPELIVYSIFLLHHQELAEGFSPGKFFENIMLICGEESRGAMALLKALEERLLKALGATEDFLGEFSPQMLSHIDSRHHGPADGITALSLKGFVGALLDFTSLRYEPSLLEMRELTFIAQLPDEEFLPGLTAYIDWSLSHNCLLFFSPWKTYGNAETFLSILFTERLKEALGWVEGYALAATLGSLSFEQRLSPKQALAYLRDFDQYKDMPVSWWLPLVREAAGPEEQDWFPLELEC